jgi:stearoyl-CoA desaturase (delta-9 desaturase)
MFQKKWDPYWNILWCFAFPAIVASYGWGESGAVGFFVPGAVRYVWVLHMTWFVNSAAHLWGERPYDPKSNPAENPLVAIASIGEGWHNWHHKYPFDYAASEYGVLQQFNPTKLIIDFAAMCGSVTERKRGTGMWKRESIKLAEEAKKAKAM